MTPEGKETEVSTDGVSLGHRKSLEAVTIRACTKCGAPGCWRVPKNPQEHEHYSKWPEIVAVMNDPEKPDGQPVGDTCPCCGTSRRGLVKDLGEIWHRFF